MSLAIFTHCPSQMYQECMAWNHLHLPWFVACIAMCCHLKLKVRWENLLASSSTPSYPCGCKAAHQHRFPNLGNAKIITYKFNMFLSQSLGMITTSPLLLSITAKPSSTIDWLPNCQTTSFDLCLSSTKLQLYASKSSIVKQRTWSSSFFDFGVSSMSIILFTAMTSFDLLFCPILELLWLMRITLNCNQSILYTFFVGMVPTTPGD